LALQLCHRPEDRDTVVMKAVAQPPGRWLVLGILLPAAVVSTRSAESDMRWAVAEKFLEMHGGTLQHKSTPSGEVLWEIVLPLQP
jgi:hypothetical protein